MRLSDGTIAHLKEITEQPDFSGTGSAPDDHRDRHRFNNQGDHCGRRRRVVRAKRPLDAGRHRFGLIVGLVLAYAVAAMSSATGDTTILR